MSFQLLLFISPLLYLFVFNAFDNHFQVVLQWHTPPPTMHEEVWPTDLPQLACTSNQKLNLQVLFILLSQLLFCHQF